jgi:hypothetical protein
MRARLVLVGIPLAGGLSCCSMRLRSRRRTCEGVRYGVLARQEDAGFFQHLGPLLTASTHLLEKHACDTGEQCASASTVGEEGRQRPLRSVCRNLVEFQELMVDQEEVPGSLQPRGTESDK